jgi:hypothetical protein
MAACRVYHALISPEPNTLRCVRVQMRRALVGDTSMSLPYHIGNGWFGGMLPLLATAVVAATGDIYAGLWYPIGVAVMTLVVGGIFLKDTKGVDMHTSSGVEQQK